MTDNKKIYFLSDFHLGAKYFTNPREKEMNVVRFLDSIKDDAAEIYLLGDILDYWYEYKYVVPRGFTRFFGKIAELSDLGIKIYWFIGNHDIWIFDYLPTELGVKVIDGTVIKEIAGKKFFLAHGDGVGNQKWTFRAMRSLFRNKFAQFLYSGIHPRWTIPFAHNWSTSSRASDKYPTYAGEGNEYLEEFAKHYNGQDIDVFIFGHRHIMLDKEIASNKRLIILGDWIHFNSYAVFDGKDICLKTYNTDPK